MADKTSVKDLLEDEIERSVFSREAADKSHS